MKSAVDMDDGSLLGPGKRGADEMETNQLHKIELWIFRTIFDCPARVSSQVCSCRARIIIGIFRFVDS